MAKTTIKEVWKEVVFDAKNSTNSRLEVSNLGRLRSFNKINNGAIIKGSITNGYPIVRLKLFKKRDKAVQAKVDDLQAEVTKLSARLKAAVEKRVSAKERKVLEEKVNIAKQKLSAYCEADVNARMINVHALVHRLVAEAFLPKPKPNQTIVAHLDYNKINNKATNLKWMTPAENRAHQLKSPYVKAALAARKAAGTQYQTYSKLTANKVAKIKKHLASGNYTNQQLSEKYGVSSMQITRISRGENWGHVAAAD